MCKVNAVASNSGQEVERDVLPYYDIRTMSCRERLQACTIPTVGQGLKVQFRISRLFAQTDTRLSKDTTASA
eukprot:461911-Amphidinium_carterae.1